MKNRDRYDKQYRTSEEVEELGTLEYLDFNYSGSRALSLGDELDQANAVSVRSRVPASFSTNPEIATFFICAAVASSSYFFGSFLSEAGKDAYAWAKTKLALKGSKLVRFGYYFEIDEIAFSDPLQIADERHDQFLAAVVRVARELPEDAFSRPLIVNLSFDSERHVYSEAQLFKRVSGEASEPLQTFDLLEVSAKPISDDEDSG